MLEAKRADEARRVRELEARLADAEAFVALRPKLQAKLGQQQTDLIAARRELADARQLAELADTRGLDAQEQLEMAALDREVAEERAETAELELEEARERLAVVEVELAVVRGGGGVCVSPFLPREGGRPVLTRVDGQMARAARARTTRARTCRARCRTSSSRSKTSASRKRWFGGCHSIRGPLFEADAPDRLRDLSQETDAEQRRRLAEMEKDIMGVDELQSMAPTLAGSGGIGLTLYTAQYDSTLIKLSNAEVQIEDLKLQLDDSMGAEEMLMQLTERNLMLGEVMTLRQSSAFIH